MTDSPVVKPLRASGLYSMLATLIDRLDNELRETEVIYRSSPVLSFGDPVKSRVATLGINPSYREFLNAEGDELQGHKRRLHTLTSLGIDSWDKADYRHLALIIEACQSYFVSNPYSAWFNRLDYVLSGLNASYYGSPGTACHIDLVPFATGRRWSEIPSRQQSYMLDVGKDILGAILRDSRIRILILNGSTVVRRFESLADCHLSSETMPSWSLKREIGPNVPGFAFDGSIDRFGGVYLDRSIRVLGFNHNLQGSFGVSNRILNAIRDWVVETAGVCE